MTKFSAMTALVLALGFAFAAQAREYTVNKEQSHVRFSGEHAGNAFRGEFGEWSAVIDFDANALEKSSIRASFTLSSAKTGNAMYDGTLPQADWFDVAKHPQGEFVSTSIRQGTDGLVAEGTLTLRGVAQPATLTFTVAEAREGESILAKAKGTLTVDRLAYGIGKGSDATAEWVSREIAIELDVSATAKQ